MKIDIILAGVGGQGILSIATVIGSAALKQNLYLKQSEVHGMSQRGGDVQSHLRISDKEIASDLIPYGKADLVVSVEPMESLRYLPMLSPDGWIVTNTTPFINTSTYPKDEVLMAEINKLPRKIVIDADKIAKELGSARSANMVILGAASPFINMDFSLLEQAIRDIFGKKGEDIVNINLTCLKTGREYAEKVK